MNIIIEETGVRNELNLHCPQSGNDRLFDFLNNAGVYTEQYLRFDEAEDAFIFSQATFDDWRPIIESQQHLEHRLTGLKVEHGDFYVDEVVANAIFNDWRDEAHGINLELDKVFGEVATDDW